LGSGLISTTVKRHYFFQNLQNLHLKHTDCLMTLEQLQTLCSTETDKRDKYVRQNWSGTIQLHVQPSYAAKKSNRYWLNTRVCGPQRRPEQFGEKKNLFILLAIDCSINQPGSCCAVPRPTGSMRITKENGRDEW